VCVCQMQNKTKLNYLIQLNKIFVDRNLGDFSSDVFGLKCV